MEEFAEDAAGQAYDLPEIGDATSPDESLIRHPKHAEYNPFHRLWQIEELTEGDRDEKEKYMPSLLLQSSVVFPWLRKHYTEQCEKNRKVIVDGKTRLVCSQCLGEWCIVADVVEPQFEQKSYDKGETIRHKAA